MRVRAELEIDDDVYNVPTINQSKVSSLINHIILDTEYETTIKSQTTVNLLSTYV